jgi:hypothetical protein
MSKKHKPTELEMLSAAISATEANIFRTRQVLAGMEAKLGRQLEEFYRQTMRQAKAEGR